MTHIDDWLDERHAKAPTAEGEKFALEWLEHFRRPAYKQDHAWLAQNALFCTYKGERYRCIGASRLGDVWLTSHYERTHGYDLRIDVADCSRWSRTVDPEPFATPLPEGKS
jgi:hypothetical protein